MRRSVLAGAILAVATSLASAGLSACDEFTSAEAPGVAPSEAGGGETDGANPVDGAIADGGGARCAPTAAFERFERVAGSVNAPAGIERAPRLSRDEREIFFHRRPVGTDASAEKLWTGGRGARTAPFVSTGLASVASDPASADRNPSLALDALTLYFDSTRESDSGTTHLWAATRATPSAGFTSVLPVPVAENDLVPDVEPFISADGEELFFTRVIANSLQIFVARRTQQGFDAPVALPGAVNAGTVNSRPVTSFDGKTLYFSRRDTQDGSRYDMWRAHRDSIDAAFVVERRVDELNRGTVNGPGWLSEDGCRLYYDSNAESGTLELWVATRNP